MCRKDVTLGGGTEEPSMAWPFEGGGAARGRILAAADEPGELMEIAERRCSIRHPSPILTVVRQATA